MSEVNPSVSKLNFERIGKYSNCVCKICIDIEESAKSTLIVDSIKEIDRTDLNENVFRNLEKLVLSAKALKIIHPKAFHSLRKLKSLLFSAPYMPTIPQKLFSPLTSLKELELDILMVSKLSSRQFEKSLNLISLRMHLSFVTIPDNVFRNLRNLEVLEIYNYSRFILAEPLNVNLQHIKSLSILNSLTLNHLKFKLADLENLTISAALGNLQGLTITKTSLIVFDFIHISQLKLLKILTLSYNELRNISNWHFLQFFKHLNELNLSHNHLSEVNIFMAATNSLRKIDLSYNCINCAKSINVGELVYLEYLHLDGCNDLRELPEHIFQNFARNHMLYIYVPTITDTSRFSAWKNFNHITNIKILKEFNTKQKIYIDDEEFSSNFPVDDNFFESSVRAGIFNRIEIGEFRHVIDKMNVLIAFCYPETLPISGVQNLHYFETYQTKLNSVNFERVISLLKENMSAEHAVNYMRNVNVLKKLFDFI